MRFLPLRFDRFNTQPPEGGWFSLVPPKIGDDGFNTQPPEGGWKPKMIIIVALMRFQHTAARRRLAKYKYLQASSGRVSTHSRPKAAGCRNGKLPRQTRGFNTQPPEGGWLQKRKTSPPNARFQHTAARRRLAFIATSVSRWQSRFNTQPPEGGWSCFSLCLVIWAGFNTQPPEGGWITRFLPLRSGRSFNTQPPEGGWF